MSTYYYVYILLCLHIIMSIYLVGKCEYIFLGGKAKYMVQWTCLNTVVVSQRYKLCDGHVDYTVVNECILFDGCVYCLMDVNVLNTVVNKCILFDGCVYMRYPYYTDI